MSEPKKCVTRSLPAICRWPAVACAEFAAAQIAARAAESCVERRCKTRVKKTSLRCAGREQAEDGPQLRSVSTDMLLADMKAHPFNGGAKHAFSLCKCANRREAPGNWCTCTSANPATQARTTAVTRPKNVLIKCVTKKPGCHTARHRCCSLRAACRTNRCMQNEVSAPSPEQAEVPWEDVMTHPPRAHSREPLFLPARVCR